MKKIHVFYHINLGNNSAGGIISFLRGLLKEISETTELHYYCMDYGQESLLDLSSINEIYLKKMNNHPNQKKRIPNNLYYLFYLSLFMLKKRFNKEDYLIFNRIDHVLPAVYLQKAAKKILIVHGSSQFDKAYFGKSIIKRWFMQFSEKKAFSAFSRIVLVSKDAYTYYIQKYPQYKDKIVFIPTFVDTDIFKVNLNQIKEYKDSQLNYIYIGRFVKEKGMNELKEYFDFLDRKNISYRATLIGEGELENLFSSNPKIEIIHTVPQTKLVEYLQSSAILLMFSHFEGMPLTLIEALASGTPAICSKAGEMKYIVTNNYNGYTFKIF